jgi:hypothetical protein
MPAAASLFIVVLVGAAMMAPLMLRLVTAAMAVFVLGGAFWLRVLEPADRAAVRGLFRRLPLEEATP